MDEVGPTRSILLEGLVVPSLKVLDIILRIGVMVAHNWYHRESMHSQLVIDHLGDTLHLLHVSVKG